MERFCSKCGSLVSGDGEFCPNCGEKFDSVVDISKPSMKVEDMAPRTTTTTTTTASTSGTYGASNNGTNFTTGGAQGQMPSYVQPIAPTPVQSDSDMTVGQWVLTIFLSGLGFIGLILLFVWAFGSDTPTSKRNYSRAMLILWAISLGLAILFYIVIFACVGIAAGSLSGLFEEMEYYAAINNLFIG